MEGAAGTLRRVEHAAYVCGAGGGGGGGWSQGGAGGVGGRDGPPLGLTVRDAAVADLPGFVLQRRRVSHGAGPRRGRTDARRLQRAGVLLHLDTGGGFRRLIKKQKLQTHIHHHTPVTEQNQRYRLVYSSHSSLCLHYPQCNSSSDGSLTVMQ